MISAFSQLALAAPVLKTLSEIGYNTPSPIQAQAIPFLLDGVDLIGQAQTGTGKTAAFALPTLSALTTTIKAPQVLVLTPTRELAIQVTEAYRKYAGKIKGFKAMAVYGGQDYRAQSRALEQGPQVVVGTPGRMIDQIKRGNLKLDALNTLILDEADEMLRMGFIDDVEWILKQTPDTRQTALFSATMPQQIRRMADRYLKAPEHVTVKFTARTADTIRQRYWLTSQRDKFRSLTQLLEVETVDAMIVFVRTRSDTTEISDQLVDAGFKSAALNGDMQQKQRERTIEQLKAGKLDIVVATDVAARGLDVERISHVLNYDSPHDVEAYIHRIGRTGRAGRSGEAILFATNREKRLLSAIQKATGKKIDPYKFPTAEQLQQQRQLGFNQRVSDLLVHKPSKEHHKFVTDYLNNHDVSAEQLAVALASQLIGTSITFDNPESKRPEKNVNHPGSAKKSSQEKRGRTRPAENEKPVGRKRQNGTQTKSMPPMVRYRVEVGSDHGANAGNIVGAIANEAGIESRFIGRISVQAEHSFVDLPEGMPKAIFKDLRKTWVCSRRLQISLADTPAQGKQQQITQGNAGKSGKAKTKDKPLSGKRKRTKG